MRRSIGKNTRWRSNHSLYALSCVFLLAFFGCSLYVIQDQLFLIYESEIKDGVDVISDKIGIIERYSFLDDDPELLDQKSYAKYFMNLAKSRSISARFLRCFAKKTSWEHEQVCCSVSKKTKEKVSCLPSLVVIGSQKGGTTALHSYLMLHPNLDASRRKELHIFDMDRSWTAKSQFKVSNNWKPHPVSYFSNRVNFETTPSYTASPDACSRMAVSLPGNTKFVLILRNPIDRAWSELQMKARRVQAQDDFKKQFYECRHEIKNCFSFSIGRLTKGLAACLRSKKEPCSSLIKHSKFKMLMKGLSIPSISLSKKGITNNFFERCFGREYPDLKTFATKCFDSKKMFREKNINLPQGLEVEIEKNRDVCVGHMYLVRALDKPKYLNRTAQFSRKQVRCWFKFFKDKCDYCKGSENEISCADTCIANHNSKFKPEKCKRSDYKSSTEPFCRGAYCACFPDVRMPSDISRGYFFRGLYGIHLNNCFKFLNRERVLIIYNSELRKETAKTMDRIIEFVDLPSFDYATKTFQDAERAFEQMYPKFEEQTGWSANGTSTLGTKIPENIKSLLSEAYYSDVHELKYILGSSPAFFQEFKDFF